MHSLKSRQTHVSGSTVRDTLPEPCPEGFLSDLRRSLIERLMTIYRISGIGERMVFEPELIPVRVTAAGSMMRGGNAVSRNVDVPGFTYGPSR